MRLANMSVFRRHEPVVVKRGGSAQAQLAALEALSGTLPKDAEKRLQKDIAAIRAGIAGESKIMYELENSHMDMFILHDLFLEYNGLSAQIDFLVITPYRNFVIECKNLYGNIGVNERGEFTRYLGYGKSEGMYSPIAQNRRHIELIYALRRDTHSAFGSLFFDKNFSDVYRSLVVLANPKTRINLKYARKEDKDKLIRADSLVETIRRINKESGPGSSKASFPLTRELAEWFLSIHKDRPEPDFGAKYRDAADASPVQAESPTARATVKKAATAGDAGSRAYARLSPEVGDASAKKSTSSVEGDAVLADAAMPPTCPRCGSLMALRTGRRGARAGQQFWGCSTYPHCRAVIEINQEHAGKVGDSSACDRER